MVVPKTILLLYFSPNRSIKYIGTNTQYAFQNIKDKIRSSITSLFGKLLYL